MFLGYQNDRIAYIAETREELEAIPCVAFDKIEETSEEYVLKDSAYMLKAEADSLQAEEEKQARIAELKRQLSYSDYVVLKIAEGSATAEEYADVLAARKRWRAEINELEANNPYPVVEAVEAIEAPEVVELSEASGDIVELYSMEI